MENKILEKYYSQQGALLAKQIDDNIAIFVKKRPKYCPKWLYKKIIRDSVEIVNQI